jgi:hypothetical protein
MMVEADGVAALRVGAYQHRWEGWDDMNGVRRLAPIELSGVHAARLGLE